MTKPRIDAKEALNDIGAGLDETSLMEKYKLSPKGLNSLLSKLRGAGLLKQVPARAFVRDLRSGMTETTLKEKYGLTESGFFQVMQQLDGSRLHRSDPERLNGSVPVRTSARRLAEIIRSGDHSHQLPSKHGLTYEESRRLPRELPAPDVVRDEDDSSQAFSDSGEGLDTILRVEKRFATGAEVLIHEDGHPQIQGTVVDISGKGVKIRGIDAKVGELKTLVVHGDPFGEFAGFRFEAECRWARRLADDEHLTGFEITDISTANRSELRLLLCQASLDGSAVKDKRDRRFFY